MAAHTPTMDLPQSTVPPSISIRISTSAHTLDLAVNIPFTITLLLTLNFATPITFTKRSSNLFEKPLYRHGLTFTNIRTEKLVPRSKINPCYFNNVGLPEEKHKDRWVTLFPDQPYVLEASFSPIDGDILKWPKVGGLKDGEIYEIGVSEKAGIKWWMKGSLEEILEMRKLNLMPDQKNQVIRFEVEETKTFEMKRPDQDGGLNWPVLRHPDPNKRYIT